MNMKGLEEPKWGAKASSVAWKVLLFLCISRFAVHLVLPLVPSEQDNHTYDYEHICPIIDYHRPATYGKYKDTVLAQIISDQEFRNQSIAKLAGAVRIATETHDEDPKTVEEDFEYWAKFSKFASYLQETFPLFHEQTELEKVNYHGLLYKWTGSDNSLKPLVLMAHQDVVPVPLDTVQRWTYPPFEGHYDGSHLWGRGVADCKNLLIGLLEASEELMKVGFDPKRTIYFSFGFDEETGGPRNKNGERLLELLGPDSVYAVVDEGGISLTELAGTWMALPGAGEKGSIDIVIELVEPEMQIDVPLEHTSIGIMSELVVAIESSPFEPIFTDLNPTFRQYRCMAEHSSEVDESFKNDIINSGSDEKANKRVRDKIDQDRALRYYIKTSQAVDIVSGDSKKSKVTIDVNHRVAVEQKTAEVVDKVLSNTKDIARKYGVGVKFKDGEGELTDVVPSEDGGSYFIFAPSEPLESAPVTPINDAHWYLFGGNIRHVYEEIADPEKFTEPIVISPGIATGNTDTKLYWDLTRHIYRYRPGVTPTIDTNAHGIDENIDFNSHLQIIAFYFEYIQSVDEADDSD